MVFTTGLVFSSGEMPRGASYCPERLGKWSSSLQFDGEPPRMWSENLILQVRFLLKTTCLNLVVCLPNAIDLALQNKPALERGNQGPVDPSS